MKYLIAILTGILLLSSCSSDTGPLLDVKFICSESDLYQRAELDVSSFSMLDAGMGISDIQQWSGNISELDLTKIDKSAVLNRFHWSMNLGAVKPRFSGRLMKDGEWKNINVVDVDGVPLMDSIMIEDNQEYEIHIKIDTDNAFVESGDFIQFDWNHVTAKAFVK